jgi:hypothetical protein
MTNRPGAKFSFAPTAHIAAITPEERVGGSEDGACVRHSFIVMADQNGPVKLYLAKSFSPRGRDLPRSFVSLHLPLL